MGSSAPVNRATSAVVPTVIPIDIEDQQEQQLPAHSHRRQRIPPEPPHEHPVQDGVRRHEGERQHRRPGDPPDLPAYVGRGFHFSRHIDFSPGRKSVSFSRRPAETSSIVRRLYPPFTRGVKN